MKWFMNDDDRDNENEYAIKMIFMHTFAFILIASAVLVVFSSCSLVELHVETQQTSRTLSEAKRNPITENSEVEKQDSIRTQENPKTTKVHVPVGLPDNEMGVTIDAEDSNPTGQSLSN